MLTEAEIYGRRPVRSALFELWLDPELQGYDLDPIAMVLHESAYDRDALDRILAEEADPVVYLNLYAVAGTWTGSIRIGSAPRSCARWVSAERSVTGCRGGAAP